MDAPVHGDAAALVADQLLRAGWDVLVIVALRVIEDGEHAVVSAVLRDTPGRHRRDVGGDDPEHEEQDDDHCCDRAQVTTEPLTAPPRAALDEAGEGEADDDREPGL